MTYGQAVKQWQSYNISKEPDIDKYLHSFRILFAYNSGKIENIEIDYHDTREVFENGKVSSFTGNVRTLFEQQNQKDCYEILKPDSVTVYPLEKLPYTELSVVFVDKFGVTWGFMVE